MTSVSDVILRVSYFKFLSAIFVYGRLIIICQITHVCQYFGLTSAMECRRK